MSRLIKTLMVLFFVVLLYNSLSAFSPGYDLGLRYGIGRSSLGQDPYMENFKDKITFLNFMISNELILNRLFRIELDCIFTQRGYSETLGDKTSYSLYFVEIPLLFKIYPFSFFYLGTGLGYAYKYKVADYKINAFASALHGIDNFVDDKTRDHELHHVLVLGFSVNLFKRITFSGELRHNYGLTNINRHDQASQLLPPKDFFERFRSVYLFVGISYKVF